MYLAVDMGARKTSLVENGFRLPSAMDNRPLKFSEWEDLRPQTIYVSATPGKYELEKTKGLFAEQVIRPTGLVDPECIIRQVLTVSGHQTKVYVGSAMCSGVRKIIVEVVDFVDPQISAVFSKLRICSLMQGLYILAIDIYLNF